MLSSHARGEVTKTPEDALFKSISRLPEALSDGPGVLELQQQLSGTKGQGPVDTA